jgi:hypothetical protein
MQAITNQDQYSNLDERPQDKDVESLIDELSKTKIRGDIRNMFFESVRDRKRTIFVDSNVADPEHIEFILDKMTWKSLTRLQKVKKIREYVKIHQLNFIINLKTVSEYKITKIIFDPSTQRITSLSIKRN